jgi:hypothetical protein
MPNARTGLFGSDPIYLQFNVIMNWMISILLFEDARIDPCQRMRKNLYDFRALKRLAASDDCGSGALRSVGEAFMTKAKAELIRTANAFSAGLASQKNGIFPISSVIHPGCAGMIMRAGFCGFEVVNF